MGNSGFWSFAETLCEIKAQWSVTAPLSHWVSCRQKQLMNCVISRRNVVCFTLFLLLPLARCCLQYFDVGLNLKAQRGERKMKQFLIFIGLCILFSSSCRSPNSPIPLRAPNLRTPVATGIFITDETGPDIIGVFGNPSSKPTTSNSNSDPTWDNIAGNIPVRFQLEVPYPNPNNGDMTIRFALPKESIVTIYIVPASFMNHEGQIIQFSNATINLPGGLAIDLLFNRNAAAGVYSVVWSGRDQSGRPFPDGFYRIYMEVNEHLLWQDALLLRDPCNAPAGLPTFGEKGCG
ncbi:MAG: hypothetical protein GWN62_02850 [Aliifodinibius sp.]|nr:hypothetical protein [Fodinibius sp.]